MERKTKIHTEEGKQDILITREFDLPVELLFKAHVEAEIVEQWMGNKVLKMESKNHGSYAFETFDHTGKLAFRANGTYHEVVPDKRIVRTFRMDVADFDVQLEFLDFDRVTDDTSTLNMQIIYRSVALRDAQLKLPFAQGINWAHNRMEEIVKKLKP